MSNYSASLWHIYQHTLMSIWFPSTNHNLPSGCKIGYRVDASTDYPPWFMSTIKRILNAPIPAPSKSPILFKLSPEAATHNANLLADMNFSLKRLIQSFPSSEIGHGSEFRPT